MRLLFSVIMLLVISSVVIEASAGKSNRGTDRTKDNLKSINSKEVRYSKNKSEFKNKENGKKNEVLRKKQQRYDVKESQKIDHNEFSKNNLNERHTKASFEEQRRQKTNKEDKIVKNVDHLKNNKNIKIVKEEAKRHKRSLELEQSEESLVNLADGNKDSKLRSLSKKEGKNKYQKQSERNNDETAEGDDILNTEEQVADNQPSKDATFSSDYKVKSSSKSKVAEKQGSDSKYTKQQKQKYTKEIVQEKNVNIKKKDSRMNVETADELSESGENIKYADELSENIENFKENNLQTSCGKFSKRERHLNDGEIKNSKKTKSRGSKNQDRIKMEKPMLVAGDNERNILALEIEQEAINNEDAIHPKSTIEDEEQDYMRAKSCHDNAKKEFCSIE